MAHGDTRKGKRKGNWPMEWVASTLHTTSEHGLSSITTVMNIGGLYPATFIIVVTRVVVTTDATAL